LYCSGCTALISLPDLPVCTRLECWDCTALISLPDLPACTNLQCWDCTALISLPDLPACTELYCKECTNLTHISIQDNCRVSCTNSPIAGYNNELYLSYIEARSSIIEVSMRKSNNYEQGVIGIIAGYL
jgi:hypothetical protein